VFYEHVVTKVFYGTRFILLINYEIVHAYTITNVFMDVIMKNIFWYCVGQFIWLLHIQECVDLDFLIIKMCLMMVNIYYIQI
jgi:hypothetical protein